MPLSFFTRTGTRSLQFFQLVRFGSLFLISIFLARVSGDKILISQYEIFLLTAGTFTFFWMHGILKAFLPYYSQSGSTQKKEIIFHNFFLMCLCSIISSAGIFFAGTLIYPAINPEFLIWVVVYSFFISPANFTEYLLFAENKRKSLVIYCIITYLLMILSVIIPVFLKMSFIYSIYALTLFSAIRFLYLLFLIIKSARMVFHIKMFRELLQYSFPLMLLTLAGGLADYFDNILVSRFFSGSEFAIFRYGARELPIVLLLANGLSTSFSSQISTAMINNNISEELQNLKKESLQLMHLTFPLTILLLIFAGPLFELLYGVSFRDASFIFRIYLLLVISRVVFPQAIASGFMLNKMMAVVSFIELTAHVSLSVLLINFIGIKGVAYAAVFSFAFEKIILGYWVKKRIKIDFLEYVPWEWLLMYSCLTILVFLWM